MKKSIYYKKHKKYKKTYVLLKYIPFIILFIIMIIFFVKFNNKDKLDISLSNVASFKISSDNIIALEEVSKKYNIDFYEMLTYYAIENNFFNDKNLDISNIEKDFIINYDSIKSKYSKKSVEPYYNLIKNIIEEIKNFPIPLEYANNYIYGDSYGAERTYGGKRIHTGTDIMDKENIVGRIPIISMTDGIIENIGWNEKGGYRVGIKSKSGNYYYYAHLDKFEEGMEKGKEILAGDTIGYMGNTGYSKIEGTKGNFETHLHLGIEAQTNLTNDELWINPYPFLSLIENRQKNSKN
nr:M23 family metallopeptidase [uncultured Tyzzerella sp.]